MKRLVVLLFTCLMVIFSGQLCGMRFAQAADVYACSDSLNHSDIYVCTDTIVKPSSNVYRVSTKKVYSNGQYKMTRWSIYYVMGEWRYRTTTMSGGHDCRATSDVIAILNIVRAYAD